MVDLEMVQRNRSKPKSFWVWAIIYLRMESKNWERKVEEEDGFVCLEVIVLKSINEFGRNRHSDSQWVAKNGPELASS